MKTLQFTQPTRGEGRFVRQSGPPGRFGHVILIVEPTNQPSLEICWEVPESAIPVQFRQAVSLGINGYFEPGAKYSEFTPGGFLVRVVGGTFHPTDSNEVSYTLAAAAAFSDAVSCSASAADAERR